MAGELEAIMFLGLLTFIGYVISVGYKSCSLARKYENVEESALDSWLQKHKPETWMNYKYEKGFQQKLQEQLTEDFFKTKKEKKKEKKNEN